MRPTHRLVPRRELRSALTVLPARRRRLGGGLLSLLLLRRAGLSPHDPAVRRSCGHCKARRFAARRIGEGSHQPRYEAHRESHSSPGEQHPGHRFPRGCLRQAQLRQTAPGLEVSTAWPAGPCPARHCRPPGESLLHLPRRQGSIRRRPHKLPLQRRQLMQNDEGGARHAGRRAIGNAVRGPIVHLGVNEAVARSSAFGNIEDDQLVAIIDVARLNQPDMTAVLVHQVVLPACPGTGRYPRWSAWRARSIPCCAHRR